MQDAYMEEEGPRGDMTIQSGLSNSTESIDSMKALTAAIEAANAQVSDGHLSVAVSPFHLKTVYSGLHFCPRSMDQPVSTSATAQSAPPPQC